MHHTVGEFQITGKLHSLTADGNNNVQHEFSSWTKFSLNTLKRKRLHLSVWKQHKLPHTQNGGGRGRYICYTFKCMCGGEQMLVM